MSEKTKPEAIPKDHRTGGGNEPRHCRNTEREARRK
jgi:hypothetical protein